MARSFGFPVSCMLPVDRSDVACASGLIPSISLPKTCCALKPLVETLARLFATTSCLRSQYRRAWAALFIPLIVGGLGIVEEGGEEPVLRELRHSWRESEADWEGRNRPASLVLPLHGHV